MSSSSSSSSGGAFRLRWDVFLSFGEDTPETFTNRLYESLQRKAIRAFMDDEALRLDAIVGSAAFIVIFSRGYADSHWRLEELATICDCGRLVLPVFYQVDPSDVRKQTGIHFEKAFRNHEQDERVGRWRNAMRKLGGLAGLFIEDSESKRDNLIQRLVQIVLKELINTPMVVAKYVVGLDDRVGKVMELLQFQSNCVRVLGLYGMGGVGKTTLAKALFNSLVGRFDRRCFLSNVRLVSSKEDGLVSLQSKIIKDLSPNEGTWGSIRDVNAGISAIRRIVHENRVLLVLDDVDDVNQLDALIDKREWFYGGSRIIITTRDTHVLDKRYVSDLYEVKELYHEEALELFSQHALRKKEPPENLLNLSKKIVSLTGRMPLALEVFGCFLFDKRRVEEWEDALEKLRRIRPGNLQDVLKISYDTLDEQEKCIFLDIASFFVQMEMKRDDVIDILRGCGFRGEIEMTALVKKCLLKITQDNTLWMHDQIRDMGRQIVLDENHVDPGMRSRLWDRPEIMAVLKSKKGTGYIQGIVLDFMEGSQTEKNNKVTLHAESFEPMVNLRLLEINNLKLEGQCLPAKLKWLQWRGCPLESMTLDPWPRELAVLDLSNAQKMKSLWRWQGYKVPENLMIMNLYNCIQLAAIPDLSGCTRLEKINLENCINLTSIHESLGSLTSLRSLNLTRCSNLVDLPSDVSGLKNLESLFLSSCSKLKAIPENIGILKSLKTVVADDTPIVELPQSIFCLTNLERLVLDRCSNLKRLPNCIGNLCSLQELSLTQSGLEELPNTVGSLKNLEKLKLVWCESLSAVPDSIGNLTYLTEVLADSSGIKVLPSSIGSLSYLRHLSVGNCKLLTELPDSVTTLASITELWLDGTAITYLPDQIGEMKQLRKLEIGKCSHLESLPESIGDLALLTSLNIFNGNIRELPESIGSLENLVTLRLNKCRMLRKLPASIGNMKSLCHLWMEETAMSDLPKSFGMLSSLRILRMAKRPDTVSISQQKPGSYVLPSSFCNLTLLYEFDARAWNISEKIPDDFEKLSSLETLNLGQNNFHSLPFSMKGLSILTKLSLPNCRELVSLPSLPSSLIELNVENCYALETIHDLSNLESLVELNLTNCERLVNIPGLGRLKSLRRLYLSGCISCYSQASKTLSKVALRNFEILSMPGTRLPDWFSGQSVRFSKPKNIELTSVIVGVVLSINPNIDIPNMKRDQMPGVIDVQANVVKLGKTIFSTVLNIRGMPRTDAEHIHLCRFRDYHQLVAFLRDADTFCVTMRDPPFDKGLRLTKCGIYLIFEGDDDYEENEELLHTSLQSVSERLAKFFNTSESVDAIHATGSKDDCQHGLEEVKEEPRSSRVRGSYIILFLISVFFVLLSWFWLRCM